MTQTCYCMLDIFSIDSVHFEWLECLMIYVTNH